MERSDPERIGVSVPRSETSIRVDEVEGGILVVALDNEGVVISGGPMALRDLARWTLAVASSSTAGAHAHFDPGVSLSDESLPLVVAQVDEVVE